MTDHVADNERHRVVMTAIIYNDQQKYLATKRSPTKAVWPGKWTVPGGGLEPSDYLDTPRTVGDAWYFVVEQALRREVREEVGIEIEKPQYLLDLIFIRPDDVPVLTLSYYAKYKSGEIVLEDGEATEYKWVTAAEAKDIDFIKGIEAEIDYVDQVLQGVSNPVLHLPQH